MTKSADNLRFYGELDSAVYTCPKGTTMPDDLDDPGVLFDDVGWLADDGIDIDRATDDKSITAYQAAKILRRRWKITGETVKFVCMEENLAVIGLAYPDAAITTTTGITKIVPSGKASKEIAGIVDLVDDDVTKRLIIVSGDAALTATIPHKSDDPTTYEITINLNDYYWLTDSPALES